MAIPINIGDIVEIRLIGELHKQVVETTWHYRADTNAADWLNQAAPAALSFETDVWGAIRTGLSTELQLVYFELQIIWPTRYRKVIHIPAARAGSSAGSSLPSGVAVVVRRQGDEAKRWSQGRVYIPGLPVTGEEDSQLAAAWIAANQAGFLAAAMADISAGVVPKWEKRIFNLKAPARITPITSAVLDKVLRYQRRREVGVGI